MTDYLTIADALAIHADLIRRYGGSQGLRDAGLLEAALFRPQTGYYADLIEEAVALWESLGQNHAFVDGNKRIAFAATEPCLPMNGVMLGASADATSALISGLYDAGSFRFDELVKWLRANSRQQAR